MFLLDGRCCCLLVHAVLVFVPIPDFFICVFQLLCMDLGSFIRLPWLRKKLGVRGQLHIWSEAGKMQQHSNKGLGQVIEGRLGGEKALEHVLPKTKKKSSPPVIAVLQKNPEEAKWAK